MYWSIGFHKYPFSSVLAVSFAEVSLLPFYFVEWWIWNRDNPISEVLLGPRRSSDGHSKSNIRDEAWAQGGTSEVWRGQGPFISILSMLLRMLDIVKSVRQDKHEQFMRYLCFKMHNHTLPSVQQIRNVCSLKTLSMGIFKHTGLYCHWILRMRCVWKTPDSETFQSYQYAHSRGKGRSRMACLSSYKK